MFGRVNWFVFFSVKFVNNPICMVPYEPSTITNDHTIYMLHIHIMVSCSSNLNFE